MDTQKQRTIANFVTDQNPELLLDMSAQVAFVFIRAKQTQGVVLMYNQGEGRHSDAARRAVMISVTYPQSGMTQYGEVRLRAQLERDSHGIWHIIRVTGDK